VSDSKLTLITNRAAEQETPRKGLSRSVLVVVFLAALLYAVVLGGFYLAQEKLIFRPSVLPPTHTFQIADTKEVQIAVVGATLSALHFTLPNPKGVIFFLHGNGGNLASWLRSTEFYRKHGYDLFMIDYRGYGKSSGEIESEAALHADVMTAWNSIAAKYQNKKKVIFGRSLGTTLAAKLASEISADWTVLVSPFYSLDDMRRDLYPFLPSALMRYTFRTDNWLPSAKSPVTILHGDRDELIAYSHAERLQSLVPTTELIRIEGGTHFNLHQLPQYREAVGTRLAKL
jgi:uncharacterized protein